MPLLIDVCSLLLCAVPCHPFVCMPPCACSSSSDMYHHAKEWSGSTYRIHVLLGCQDRWSAQDGTDGQGLRKGWDGVHGWMHGAPCRLDEVRGPGMPCRVSCLVSCRMACRMSHVVYHLSYVMYRVVSCHVMCCVVPCCVWCSTPVLLARLHVLHVLYDLHVPPVSRFLLRPLG